MENQHMRFRTLRWETLLYALAFLIGLSVRLASIGRLPLTDAEATLALQAAGIASGQDVLLAPHPAYLSFTTLLMALTSASDWTARFWPALAGSLMILTPLFFRRWLGRFPALVLAWGLTIDPGLLAAARVAGSPTIAILGLTAAVGFALRGKPVGSGIAAAIALLGGPSIWAGLLGLLIALAAFALFDRRISPRRLLDGVALDWRSFFLALGVTLFFAGTLFFFVPRGLSALGGSLPAFFAGWSQRGVPLPYFMAALLGYEFFPLLLGIWAAVMGLRSGGTLDRFLVIWWAAALGLALINPGRQPYDFTWAILPFGILAARQMAHALKLPRVDSLPILGQSLLTALLLTFLSMGVFSLVNNWQSASREAIAIRSVGALVLLLASVLLIGWGWSRAVTLRGFTLGALLVVVVFAISTGWFSAGLAERADQQAWVTTRALPDHYLLRETIAEIRLWGGESDSEYQLVVAGVDTPALRWALRDDPYTSFVDQLPRDSSPALVITPDQPELALAAAYRGQSFVLSEEVAWQGLQPHEWLRWFAFRVTPAETVVRQRAILWARGDVFAGGSFAEQQTLPLEVQPEGEPAP